MDYITLFREKNIEDGTQYPLNDISIARLFYDIHSKNICYVIEPKIWYSYDGRRWVKGDGGLGVMEYCKRFVQALAVYADMCDDGSEESKAFIKYVAELHKRRRREGLLSDAKSILPKSLAHFDRDRMLFNCHNGTFSLKDMALHPHRAEDYITKISRVKYNANAFANGGAVL
jgi:putative DNA primase/helicase